MTSARTIANHDAAGEKPLDASHSHTIHPAGYSTTTSKDLALTIVSDHAEDIDPLLEARVVRKIDWFLIPAMIVGMLKPATLKPSAAYTRQVMALSITIKPFLAQLCSSG